MGDYMSVINCRVINCHVMKCPYTPPKAHFSEEHISAPRGAAPPNFYTR